MRLQKIVVLAVLVCGLVWAAPAAANGGHHGRDGRSAERGDRGGNVPSRVADRVRRAERALERAEERADDGETAGAVSSLASARRNLAAALRSAKRRVTAGNETGPAAIRAVVRAQHHAVESTAGLFDGAEGELVDALEQTLDAAIAGRDEAIAAIAALPEDDRDDYAFVVRSIDEDAGDEIEAIDEALEDDTLTPAARQALTEARAALEAGRTSAQPLVSAAQDDGATADVDDDGSARRGGRGCDRDGDGVPDERDSDGTTNGAGAQRGARA